MISRALMKNAFQSLSPDTILIVFSLIILESTIKGAGDGLFTRSKINKGDDILCISDADNIHSTHISKKIFF
jgi:hypothetical protein